MSHHPSSASNLSGHSVAAGASSSADLFARLRRGDSAADIASQFSHLSIEDIEGLRKYATEAASAGSPLLLVRRGEWSVRLDSQQLDLVRGAVGRAKNGFNWERLLTSVQVVATLLAGIWALYLFKTFQRQNNELTLEGQRLTNEHEQLISKHDEQALKLAKFDVESIPLEREHRELVNRLLQRDETSKALSIKEQQMRKLNVISRLELKRVDTGPNMLVSCRAKFSLDFINESKQPVEVTYVIIDYMMGRPAGIGADLPGMTVVHLPTGDDQGAASEWKRIGTLVHWYAPSMPVNKLVNGVRPQPGGGTARLFPGEHSNVSYDFVVRAESNDWIACTAHIGLDGGLTDEDRWKLDSTISVAEAETRTPRVPSTGPSSE